MHAAGKEPVLYTSVSYSTAIVTLYNYSDDRYNAHALKTNTRNGCLLDPSSNSESSYVTGNNNNDITVITLFALPSLKVAPNMLLAQFPPLPASHEPP